MIGPLCSSNAGMANEDFGVRCLGTALVPKRRQAGALQNCSEAFSSALGVSLRLLNQKHYRTITASL